MNWRKIDRNLCEVYHLTPRQIDQLTLGEIALLLEDAETASKQGDMSGADMADEMRRWAGMTNRERLEEVKARYGTSS